MTRRGILGALGSSVAMCAAPIAPHPTTGSSPQTGEQKPYDLLIKGGKVIDPSQGLEAELDVAVRDGKIASVAPAIPEGQAGQVVRAHGKIVTPGLIDVHTHVFPYVGPYGIEPDPYCVRRGVTTVIDAGTSGALTFPAFRRFIIERAATRIRALLHVVSIGMVAGGTANMGELEDLRYCVPKLAVETANQNRDLIVGFKIRFSEHYTGPNDLEGMRRARAAADEAGLPIMIHIGGSYTPLKEFLALMKKGDVVTHSFNSHPHGLLDTSGKLTPEVVEARQRGVLFDVGHGAGSFSFEVMEKCLGQGFSPDTISSDLYSANINGPVYDQLTVLSKFLALGMSLRDVIARATVNAARVFNFGAEIGTIKPGAEADVSVLDLKDGEFTFTDSDSKTRMGRKKLEAVTTVKGGKVFEPTA
ncbi:MAG: amidohydrolase/deacetylase family metallohydrolase [Terriglobia bacterium]